MISKSGKSDDHKMLLILLMNIVAEVLNKLLEKISSANNVLKDTICHSQVSYIKIGRPGQHLKIKQYNLLH